MVKMTVVETLKQNAKKLRIENEALKKVCRSVLERFITLEDADEATPNDIEVRKEIERVLKGK